MKKLPDSDDGDAANPPVGNQRLCMIGEADLFIARLLRRYASTCGLRTLCVQTGEELLAWAQSSDEPQRDRPVLIILDPELPGKVRGWDVVRALQRVSETDRHAAVIPVVLCTWLGEAEAQALAGWAAPCLQKPDVHYDDFIAALERAGVLPGTPHSAA